MLKNTDEKMTIKNMSKGKRVFLTSGIVLTSLCLGLSTKSPENVDDAFNNYAGLFKESSQSLEGEEFDSVFEQFYNTGTVLLNDKDYGIKSLYIKTMEDDNNYLTEAGENIDLLTNLSLTGKKKDSLALRKADFLYDIYKEGYIKNNVLTIDNEKLKDYLASWDGKEHSEVRRLKIEQKANEEYHKKYGKTR